MLSESPKPPADTMPQTSTQFGRVAGKGHGSLSRYKDWIWDVCLEKDGNISEVCGTLKLMGIETTDKTLKKHVEGGHFPSKKQLKGCS